MGDVLTFPGTYGHEAPLEETGGPNLVDLAEDFARLRNQQRCAEQGSALPDKSPAQCRMNRLTAQVLEIKIDRVVQRLQKQPADSRDAKRNVRSLFALADYRPQEVDVLEEAALYTVSAYWDAGLMRTPEVAPLLRGRAVAAQLRHGSNPGVPPTVDAIHAVVTQHVVGCSTGDHMRRLHQIEQYDLLEYFDYPTDDPDGFPPAA